MPIPETPPPDAGTGAEEGEDVDLTVNGGDPEDPEFEPGAGDVPIPPGEPPDDDI